MIHNIVTDKDWNEHQAVAQTGVGCFCCSLSGLDCYKIKGSECTAHEIEDNASAIYKRRIKIGDIKK